MLKFCNTTTGETTYVDALTVLNCSVTLGRILRIEIHTMGMAEKIILNKEYTTDKTAEEMCIRVQLSFEKIISKSSDDSNGVFSINY